MPGQISYKKGCLEKVMAVAEILSVLQRYGHFSARSYSEVSEYLRANLFAHQAPWECEFPSGKDGYCMSGKRPKTDQEYFEILSLCVLQAGLSWKTVRRNWPRIRKGFYGFKIDRLARSNPKDLMRRVGVFRNRRKVEAIIANARTFQKLISEYGSFRQFLRTLKDPIKELRKRFRYIGTYTGEYFLHSVGYWK